MRRCSCCNIALLQILHGELTVQNRVLKLDLSPPCHQIICHNYQVIEHLSQYFVIRINRNISYGTNGWTQATYENRTHCCILEKNKRKQNKNHTQQTKIPKQQKQTRNNPQQQRTEFLIATFLLEIIFKYICDQVWSTFVNQLKQLIIIILMDQNKTNWKIPLIVMKAML